MYILFNMKGRIPTTYYAFFICIYELCNRKPTLLLIDFFYNEHMAIHTTYHLFLSVWGGALIRGGADLRGRSGCKSPSDFKHNLHIE